jgi:hypothetical protein
VNYFSVTYGLNGSTSQTQVMDKIRGAGGDAIQTSDGLCVRLEGGITELEKILEGSAASLKALEPGPALKDPNTPADVKAFLGA